MAQIPPSSARPRSHCAGRRPFRYHSSPRRHLPRRRGLWSVLSLGKERGGPWLSQVQVPGPFSHDLLRHTDRVASAWHHRAPGAQGWTSRLRGGGGTLRPRSRRHPARPRSGAPAAPARRSRGRAPQAHPHPIRRLAGLCRVPRGGPSTPSRDPRHRWGGPRHLGQRGPARRRPSKHSDSVEWEFSWKSA